MKKHATIFYHLQLAFVMALFQTYLMVVAIAVTTAVMQHGGSYKHFKTIPRWLQMAMKFSHGKSQDSSQQTQFVNSREITVTSKHVHSSQCMKLLKKSLRSMQMVSTLLNGTQAQELIQS